MSRYLLLIILTAPFILAAILGVITQYKMQTISKRRFYVQLVIWILVLIGLIAAQPIYIYLFSTGLTQTESLSLFDVVQITAIVGVSYVAYRTRTKFEILDSRLKDLHQELAIRLSNKKEL